MPIKRSEASSKFNRALLNEEIRDAVVRLVGANGNQIGIVPRETALAEAKKEGLDLVLIAPDSSPPVVKVLDYGKHLFELKKARSASRKKQKQIQVREIRFRETTDTSDYNIKLKKLIGFLNDGDKAKVSLRLRLRGGEVAHPEIGMSLLDRIESDLSEVATVELKPRFEGRNVTMVLAPIRKKGRAQAARAS